MKKKKILTVTLNPAIDYSVTVPAFRLDSVNRASGGRRDPGGKGINVATVTARYGIDSTVTGFLGDENCGIFDEHFAKFLLRDEFIRVAGQTREGIKITDPGARQTTDINFSGFTPVRKDVESFLERFDALAAVHDWVLFCGSPAKGLPLDFYACLARTAREAGALTAADTSGDALRLAVESGCLDLIKPNTHELKEAFGISDPSALLQHVNMVLLSMGAEGSMLYTDEGTYKAGAPDVEAVTTVGAGDSLLAGFVSGVIFGKSYEDSLRFAAATAASKMTKFGPGQSEEYPPGLFYEKVEVSRLN